MDEQALAAALAAAGSPYDLAALDALIDGLEAAAPGYDPCDWHALVAAEPDDGLRRRLDERRAERAKPPQEPPVVDRAERLASLRAALAGQDCVGMILPRTDAHRSEYLPANAQRVAWLTGFTGSAGTAVVLAEEAALFVDGRYTVQARQQVDEGLFAIVSVEKTEPLAWLGERLKAGQRLGYDPALQSAAEVERLQRACAKRDASAVALAANPVDTLWTDRAPSPVSALAPLDVRYAGEAEADKRLRMAKALTNAGADAAVITACDSLAWLLNLRAHDIPYNPLFMSFGVLHADGRVDLFADPRRKPLALQLDNAVSIAPMEAFPDALQALGAEARPVLVDRGSVNAAIVTRLGEAGARVIEGADPCVRARAIKNETELAGARAAQVRDGAAMVRFLAWLDQEAMPGEIDEMALAGRIDAERAKDPLFRGLSFDTISASGPNAALPHYRVTPASSRPLDDDNVYLVDSGGQYLDATTDVTRTVSVGRPDARVRAVFTAVLQGHIAIARSLFPTGTRGIQLDSFARRPLWRMGLDFDHGTGHGIGSYLCVHEGPQRIAKRGADAALEPGMIVSNEPGYYSQGHFGIRIENLVAIARARQPEDGERELLGFETLTRVPIDRSLIDVLVLEEEELGWVDRYHAKVRNDLMPVFKDEPDLATWLAAATAPLRQDTL
jgi:Xaa-Pro aminopeptidase